MLSRMLAGGSVALALLVSGGELVAQPMDIRPGQWQWTITIKGGPSRGAETAMPPEIAAMLGGQPVQVTTCISAEEIKEGWSLALDDDDDGPCKVRSRKVVGNAIDQTRTCPGPPRNTEVSHFEILSPEAIRGTLSSTRDGASMVVGRWLSAMCQD